MKLRDHPRDHPWLSYKSARSWPPIWIWKRGDKNTRIEGELGILKGVQPSSIEPYRFFLLVMEHDGQEYEGILLFEEAIICRQVYEVLVQHLGESILQIGDIDLNQ
jgi:hypothetical protein